MDFFCVRHGTYQGDEITAAYNTIPGWVECPKCIYVKEHKLCVVCEKHLETVSYSNSAMDTIHGMSINICQCCYVKQIEMIFKQVSENLTKQTEILNVNKCKEGIR